MPTNTASTEVGPSWGRRISTARKAFEHSSSRALQNGDGVRLAIDIRERLLVVLFGKPSNIVIVALAILTVGTVAYARNATSSIAVLSFVGFVLLCARSALVSRFDRHRLTRQVIDVDQWLSRFGVLAVASSVCWGALTLVCLVASHDPVLYVLALVSNFSTAGALSARNGAFPRLAMAQLFVSLAPGMIGCLFADDRAYAVLSCLTPGLFYGLTIVVRDTHKQLVDLFQTEKELSYLSYIDGLTGAFNRRYFDQELDQKILTLSASGSAIGLMMIDVDFFKMFNDHHGHPAGDGCLRAITAILKRNLTVEGDMVCRYGGEEFAVLLARTSSEDISTVARDVCRSVASAALPHGGRRDGTGVVTISIGVAVVPDHPMSSHDLVTAADGALYDAKRFGRNRCRMADPSGRQPGRRSVDG